MQKKNPELTRLGRRLAWLAMIMLMAAASAGGGLAALRGHGGPVRAIAIAPDGRTAITGSFDSAAIVWDLATDNAGQVLRFHRSAVNAVAMLPDGRLVTAGEDAKIALWHKGNSAPAQVWSGHTAPIAALAVNADGSLIASAAWDRSVRLWRVADGAMTALDGHADNVNGVAFTDDGKQLISAGYDATLRFWALAGSAPLVVQTPSPINGVRVSGEMVVTAHADGKLRLHDLAGVQQAEIAVGPTPLISLALSPDGKTIAAAGLRGAVAVIDRDSRAIRTLVGPALPVWALAFTPDGATILAAGSDRLVRRWDARTGEARDGTLVSVTEDILKKYAGDAGAQVYRACVACHTLSPDDGNRAGPTLHGLFGRRIATAPGYHYSDALRRMDIVWSPETVARLFEIGPMAYTPGTKMPEQTLSSAQDRADLVAFLQRVQQDSR